MRHLTAKRLAILTLGLAGALLIPSNGSAQYYPWGGGYYGSSYYTGYFPSYTSYYPNYWDGYYGGPYTAGYYPLSYGVGYYGSSCCGSCGPTCGTGCGSCGTSCGSCGVGCGSCGSGCCGTSFGCGSCGCGIGGCGGLACSSGCGSGTATGSDCSGSPPAKPPGTKKAQPDTNDNFEPRPSPTYDDTPPPRNRKKASPATPPDLGPGAAGPTGGTSIDGGDPQAIPPKGSAGDFKTPTPGTTKPPGDAGQAFDAKKPVGPPPSDKSGKKAPIKNGPDADASDGGENRSMASNAALDAELTNNPALHLQEQATWSYTGIERPAVAQIASTASPIPRRVKSPMIEWAPATVVAKVVRN
jgi:hypothetical protein